MSLIVFVNKIQVESFGLCHVQLDGSALPRATQGIFNMQIDFRSIKSTITFIYEVVLFISYQS